MRGRNERDKTAGPMGARFSTLTFVVAGVLTAGGCGRSAPERASADPTPVPGPGPGVPDPRTPNIALWDEFAAEIESIEGSGDRQARVNELWGDIAASGGGTPLRGEGRLVFLLRDADDDWTVAGTFNEWSANETALTRIEGTNTLVAEVAVAGDSRHEYKLVEGGDDWKRDPAGRWVAWDRIDTGTVGAFNSVAFAGEGAPLGRSVLHLRAAFESDELGNDRDVFVQVPASYFPEREPLPLLVMHDGNESLTRGRFDLALDDARDAGAVPPVLVAYVALSSQDDRIAEYTFGTEGSRGDLYTAFIADELVPALEEDFSTPRTPGSRGVMGASLGGLISYRIAFDRPDVFGLAGGQSSSFFWNDGQILEEFAAAETIAGRWYLDAGEDADNGVVTAGMRDILEAKGADHLYVRDPSAQHVWNDWAERLPAAVEFLFE